MYIQDIVSVSAKNNKKGETNFVSPFCRRRPIFPARLQASIVGTVGLNCRVRNGYGWTPAVITTDSYSSRYIRRYIKRKERRNIVSLLCWRRPIFPVRLQTSIVGTVGLNCRVRNGYGWTPAVITTNCFRACTLKTEQCLGLGA